ncbi:DUF2062 domain-containing protein [Akkermansiaceae bacterium]|nr:DUF2062 domain-containing protein [Akkermansiaceae bacterium]MDA7887194.1 DUF2062 domain-containing protein [bacterium]MDA7896411.1 DUF2062 domain-containing protein [bacterium]MDA7933679.1 DUF2062 domain-containing protein [Akkermansiaceae bacterium]MDB4502198.1 DUF2062 domain-containing protein [Akkermansiaceae bacterium]
MNVEVSEADPWWKRWFINPILNQLRQGISADKLSWTIALGCAFGIFPVMGTTSVVCLIPAAIFKLNQPVIHAVRLALWPVHLALILPFIKIGQWFFGSEQITGSVPTLLKEFFESPARFAENYWLAALQGIAAWSVAIIPLIFIVRAITLPILRATAARIAQTKQAPA